MSSPNHLRLSPLAAILAIALTAPDAAAGTRTIFHDGQVFTADPDRPWAQAVAVEGDHVIAVGSNAEVLPLANRHARVIDLGGRTMIPGLNDAHVHVLVPQGAYLNTPDFRPGPGPTLTEVLDLVASGAASTPPGTWLFAFIGSNVFDDPGADRFAIDAVAPDHPVALFAWTGHGTWLDTRAMQTLGISETEPDPFGGHYERQPGSQVLTGVAHEYAEFGIRRRLLSALPDAALAAQYQAFAGQAVALGFTSLQDMAVSLPRDRVVSVLRAANLPLRVRSMCFPLTPGESCEVSGGPGSPWVTATGVKWVTDGTPVERLAFVETAYADRPGTFGTFNLPEDPLRAIMRQHRTGPAQKEQLLFHSVGDGAIDNVLDALEDTGGPAVWQHRRTRVEHGDLLFPWDFCRARDLGVVVVQNATHLALTATFAERFTPGVFSELEPLQSLLAQGIPLALGTDGIGQPISPFVDLFLATIHPTHPSEALTIEQAVIAYTRGSAYAEFEEHRKGTIAPGRVADLAVLSQDIFHAPPPAIPATYSLLTMVDGQIVWDAGAL